MGSSPEINTSLTIEIINVFTVDLGFRLESSLLLIKDLKYNIKKRGVVVCKVSLYYLRIVYLLKSESAYFFLS